MSLGEPKTTWLKHFPSLEVHTPLQKHPASSIVYFSRKLTKEVRAVFLYVAGHTREAVAGERSVDAGGRAARREGGGDVDGVD
jgi:hypothetical protein